MTAVAKPRFSARPLGARLFATTALSTFLGLAVLAGSAQAAQFNVGNEDDLRNAIDSAQNGDTILFTGNIKLTDNLPILTRTITIDGGNHSLSGDGKYRGLFVQSGVIDMSNLTISNAVAVGGSGGNGWGGGGGGGGAGLGGALFVGGGARLTVTNVNLENSRARGGNGGNSEGGNAWYSGGGGGYFPTGAPGGNASAGGSGGGGTGGGGNGYDDYNGNNGGFGGGGGGSGQYVGGAGGLGGGGGGSSGKATAAGGFLGGAGGAGRDYEENEGKFGGGGGGGAGLGGAVFVEEGGGFQISGKFNVSGSSAAGGAGGKVEAGWNVPPGAGAGGASGAGLFLAGNGQLTFLTQQPETILIADSITDQTGAGGTGDNAGSWAVVVDGLAHVTLTGVNSYSGGTFIKSGHLTGNTASIKGNLLNDMYLIFEQDFDGTYTGNISGRGILEKYGKGNLTLSGNNQFTGTYYIADGNLLIESDANLGPLGEPILFSDINPDTSPGIGVAFGNGQVINHALTLGVAGRIYVGENEHNPGAKLTWAGVIDGPGELTVSGGGNLELTADNQFISGIRIVEESTLLFTTDNNLGSAESNVLLDNGRIATTNDAADGLSISRALYLAGNGGVGVGLRPLVWSGNISGTGTLTKFGDGVLVLTGLTNSYSGGTRIERGTLQVSSDDKLGAAGTGISIGNNGLLWASADFTTARPIQLFWGGGGFLLDTGTTLTLTGSISGEGTLSLVGNGTLVLDLASASYTGIANYGGTIQADSRFLNGDIAFDTNAQNTNARAILFAQSEDGVFAGNIGGIGGVQGLGSIIKMGAAKLTLAGTSNFKSQNADVSAEVTILQGTLQGNSNNLTGAILNNAALIFDQDFDGSYAGHISGTGTLTKNGTGKLNLTGTSSVGGGTTINAGTLAVNGPLTSDIVLNAGGTLSGVGNIKGDITNNGGSIRPGNSIGHLVFDGNFTLNSGSLGIEIDASGNSDRISVIGAGHRVNIDAGTLEITAAPGRYIPNTRYTIITTEAGGSVHFNEVTGGVGFMTPEVSIDANDIYVTLVLSPGAFSAAGQTRNQQAVGAALDAAAASGNVGGIVTTMANLQVSQGAAALQTLGGQPYADWATVNLRAAQLFTSTVGRQMAIARGGSSGGSRAALAEPGSEALAGVSMWISGVGSRGSVDGDGNAAGVDTSLGGVTFGFDYRLNPGLLIGVAGGYVSGSQSVDGFSGDTDAETLSIAAYGSFGSGALHVDALAGYANARNSLKRDVASAGLAGGRAMGDSRADQILGQIEAGYRIALGESGKSAITPFGRLQIVTNSQNGFRESDGGEYALAVASRSTTSARSVLGGDFAARFNTGKSAQIELGLRLGWVHEFADTARSLTAAFVSAPGNPFTVQGAPLPRDSALVGASAGASVSRNVSLFASYDGELAGGSSNNQFRGGIRVIW